MQLVVQSGPDAGKSFDLNMPIAVLGRQVGCDILLNDSQISRRHAQIENRNGAIFVTDLGSANGSYINGQRLAPSTPHPVRPGDNLRFGDTNTIARDNFGNVAAATEVAMPHYQAPAAGMGYSAPAAPVAPPVQQPPTYQQPALPVQTGYQGALPVQPGYQPQGYQQPPGMGYTGQPPVGPQPYAQPQPQKKGNGGLIAALVGGIVVIAAAVVVLVLVLTGNKDNNPTTTVVSNGTPGVNVTTKAGDTPGVTTAATTAVATTTVAQGASGTNAPPPSPAPPTPTPLPRTTTVPATTAAVTTAAGGGPVNALGVSVTFPSDWQTKVSDQGDNGYISGSSSGAFVTITKISGLGNDLTTRANAILSALKKNYPDLNVTKQPTVGQSGNVTLEIDYTSTSTKVLVHEYMLLTENSSKVTYIIEMGAEKSKFDSQVDTFNSILDSIRIS